MAYLGRGLDKISNIEVLDNITFDGSSSYSITKGSVAFTPNSAQSLLISIDGVVQATNFTVNSSTIDFGVAIPSTSVCNFFLHYGTGVMTVPSDGSVTTAKLGSNAVSSAKMFSGFANGITEADQWSLTANITANAEPISSNLERVGYTGFGKIGTGMSVSSGIWTFPSTGLYLIGMRINGRADTDFVQVRLKLSTDGSTPSNDIALVSFVNTFTESGKYDDGSYYQDAFVNVTDTSNFKISFHATSINTGTQIAGSTDYTLTGFKFIRLGDSQ
jgi:hypothetical protein